MAFKRLTVAQRDALAALRALGEMVVSPQDARSLAILKKRGLLRYVNRDGVRCVKLRETEPQKAAKRRLIRATRWTGWTDEPKQEHEA